MRLIDADYGQKQLTIAEVECGKNFETDCNHVRDFLNAMPTIDAVPVRCRECKHHYWEQEPCHGKSVHYCNLSHMRGIEVFKEFFCYYGERKEGAD